MKTSLLLLSSALAAFGMPKVDVVVETAVVYLTVTEIVDTIQTSNVEDALNTSMPTITVIVSDVEALPTPANTDANYPTDPSPPLQEAPPPPVENSPPPPVENAPAPEPVDFASTAVFHHNIHRVNNSAPAMIWGPEYAEYAAEVAASCNFAHDLKPGGGGYGQNIAMYASTNAKSLSRETVIAQAITEMWYNGELETYPPDGYGKPTPDFTEFEKWGHYSQIVWVGSTQVGCAAQYCEPGKMTSMDSWFTVCNYFPAGNVGGAYGENVLPPTRQDTVNVHVDD